MPHKKSKIYAHEEWEKKNDCAGSQEIVEKYDERNDDTNKQKGNKNDKIMKARGKRIKKA